MPHVFQPGSWTADVADCQIARPNGQPHSVWRYLFKRVGQRCQDSGVPCNGVGGGWIEGKLGGTLSCKRQSQVNVAAAVLMVMDAHS